jgi:site-specific recombinase XerD
MKLDDRRTLALFGSYLEGKAYSPKTVERYCRDARYFMTWAKHEKNIDDAREVTAEDIEEYGEHVAEATKADGSAKYSLSTRSGMMRGLSVLFRHLYRCTYIVANPFDRVEVKIRPRYGLRMTLSEEEMAEFLDGIGTESAIGLRDRCVFELMYGTGLRIGEVRSLDVTDVDVKEGRIFVRMGKGRKERIAPMGKNLVLCVERYLAGSRSVLTKRKEGEGSQAMFLTSDGGRMPVHMIRVRLKHHLQRAELWKKGMTPHTIRHSFATHLLENGASLKHVKDLLGHESMQTTVVYTHINAKSMKKIVKMYHPRENELYEELVVDKRLIAMLKGRR